MKRKIITYLSVIFLLISCQNNSQSSVEFNKNTLADEQVKNKNYYIEFISLDSANKYINIIEQVKNELYNNGYIVSQENTNNNWQGIRKIDTTEHIIIRDVDKHHPNIHKFKDLSEYNLNDKDVEKIVITFNKPINDTIPNFNYHSFKKLGHDDWQSVFNPGNFRHEEKSTFNETELANWVIRHIVLLTFK